MRKRFGCLFDIFLALAFLGVAIGICDSAFGSMDNSLPTKLVGPKGWYPGNQPSDPSTPNPMLAKCPKHYVCDGQIPGHPGPTPASGSGSGSSGTFTTFTPFPNPTVTVTIIVTAPAATSKP